MYAERRRRILEMINAHGLVSLTELERAFPGVSTMTLRRDLAALDGEGLLIRVRRGARAVQIPSETPGIEPVYEMRAVENIAAKDAIARAALPYIEAGRSTFFDSGTTVIRLAHIAPDLVYSAVTQAPNIALELAKRRQPEVLLLGGTLHRGNGTLIGPQSLAMLEDVNIDTAILAASGYDPTAGFTCGNTWECEIKKRVVSKARRRVMLIDQSKLDRVLPLTFARTEHLTAIILDGPPKSANVEAAIRDMGGRGAEVILAEVQQYVGGNAP